MPFRIFQYGITEIYLSTREKLLVPSYRIPRIPKWQAILRLIVCLLCLIGAACSGFWVLLEESELPLEIPLLLCATFTALWLSVLYMGFIRGAAVAGIAAGVTYSLILFYRLLTNIWQVRTALAVFLVVDILLIFGYFAVLFYLWYHRRHFCRFSDYQRGNSKVGVSMLPPNLHLRKRYPDAFTCLYTVSLTFPPSADLLYYRQTVASDLADFAEQHRLYLAGCRYVAGTDQFLYYLYGNKSPGNERRLRRFFFGYRKAGCTVTRQADEALSMYRELLPNVQELFRMYNSMLLSAVNPDLFRAGEVYGISFFLAFQTKEEARAFAIDREVAAYSLVQVDFFEDEPEKVTSASDPSEGEIPSFSCLLTLQKSIRLDPYVFDQATDLLCRVAEKYQGQLLNWDVLPEAKTAEA